LNEPHLREFRVKIIADKEKHTLTVYAPDERQAGIVAVKLGKELLDVKTVRIIAVEATKYRPLA